MPHTITAQRVRLRAAAFLLLAVLGVVASTARSAAAADTAAPWTVRTAANEYGADRPSYGYTVNAGGHVADGLVVVNRGSTPLRLVLYAADVFATEAGRLGLLAEGAKSTGVGAWVHPGRDDVTVRPGASVEVPFAIVVPKRAAPGDYLGGIVAAPAPAHAGRRVGIRIRVRVGGTLEPGLAVEGLHVRYSHGANPFAKGDATVSYTIRNTGNAILTARQTVSISGPFGRWAVDAGKVPDSPALLPDGTWNVAVPVRGVAPAVRLTATVTLVPLLTDAAGSTLPLAPTEASGHAWAPPWTLLTGLVVLCALAVAGVAFARRRNGVT